MTVKSVITCDMEGRIVTYNPGAEEVFGWTADEVVGKRRVSMFSPGPIVLGHVGNWLKTADVEGRWEGRTVFVRRDGSPFAADVRITPTFKDGEQMGYCGVSTPLPDVSPDEAYPPISLATRLFTGLVITRAPFLTATIVPVLVAAAAAWAVAAGPFPWGLFSLVMVAAMALHVAANTFNDHFDWVSGTDADNNDYFMPFSGGSRAIELGLISARGVLWVGLVALAAATAIGSVLVMIRGPALVGFGLIGALSAWFYTAPPLRLAARKGLGELFIGLNFGPLMTAGTAFALTGQLGWQDFAMGIPVGLLTTAIVWVNEFPDAPSDERVGKHNLVVVLGRRRARWGYVMLVAAAFASIIAAVIVGLFPMAALLALLALPVGAYTATIVVRHYDDRTLARACAGTVALHLLAGLLLAAGLALG